MYATREGLSAMHLSGIDQAFWFASFAGEILLAATLFYRRQFKVFPFFLTWVLVTALSEVPLFWVSQHWEAVPYQRVYIISTVLDFMLQIGVLIEIACHVLRPQKGSRPRRSGIGLISCLAIAFLMTVLWTLHESGDHGAFSITTERLFYLSFAFAFLRLILFALIAGFSQMLGITWRNHVLRLASGLAFYSAVSLVTQLTISHLSTSNKETYTQDFHLLTHLQMIGYLLALVFWVWSFVQKDAPRREFTPQMERFLVTMTQTARRSRVGFARNLGHK